MIKELEEYLNYRKETRAYWTWDSDRKFFTRLGFDLVGMGYASWGDLSREWLEQEIIKWRKVNKWNTIQVKVQKIQQLFQYLSRQGYILVNTLQDIELQPQPRRVIPPPSISEVEILLENPEGPLTNRQRNLAIVELLYSTGIRKGEIYRLNVSDIIGDEIRVIGKGNKERIVPLGKRAKVRLQEYIQGDRLKLLKRYQRREEALFLSLREGKRLCLFGYTKAIEQLGIKMSPHMFRRACATHMLKNGSSVRVLQKLLGHSQISVTEQYTHLTIDTMQAMLTKYHPRP